MTLYLGDKEVGRVTHSGTSDITTSHIYETHAEAWEHRRNGDWLKCECGGEPLQVKARGMYGAWTMWVCLPCKAVVHCPESADAVLGALSYGGSDEDLAACKAEIEKFEQLEKRQP